MVSYYGSILLAAKHLLDVYNPCRILQQDDAKSFKAGHYREFLGRGSYGGDRFVFTPEQGAVWRADTDRQLQPFHDSAEKVT